jgi:hypothetical protein
LMMPPRLRRLVLAIHLTLSVGWVGAVAAYLALDVTTASSADPQRLRSAYLGMDTIASTIIVPLALASFLTGLVMSLGTKWGLFRHYWVLISFVLTVIAAAVLLIETRTISSLAAMAADPTATADQLRSMGSTLAHSIGGTLVLLVVLVLNLYKPRGMTKYGWRRQQRERSMRVEPAFEH